MLTVNQMKAYFAGYDKGLMRATVRISWAWAIREAAEYGIRASDYAAMLSGLEAHNPYLMDMAQVILTLALLIAAMGSARRRAANKAEVVI